MLGQGIPCPFCVVNKWELTLTYQLSVVKGMIIEIHFR